MQPKALAQLPHLIKEFGRIILKHFLVLNENDLQFLLLSITYDSKGFWLQNDLVQQIRISAKRTEGDALADNVLDCLRELACLYGEQFILLQYLPYAWDMVRVYVLVIILDVKYFYSLFYLNTLHCWNDHIHVVTF